MFEYTGAIHIHTRYSDGTGSLRTIIEAARRARTDFIVISDHNNMRIREEGGAGWHDDVLVIIGEEVSPRFNHYMAIGVQKEIPPDETCAQRNIDAVTRQGGLGFVAHPFGRHRPCSASSWLDKLLKLNVTVYPWNDFGVEGFDGIEVWQYMYDWVKSLNSFNVLAHLIAPNRFITGPDAETMRMWDESNRSRKVVGIGTLDAHGKPSILRMFPACSYEYLLGTVRTHILTADPFTRSGTADEQTVIHALREGRCFFANDKLGDSTGFRFYLKSEGSTYQMGEQCPLRDETELLVMAPQEAEIRVMLDGKLLSKAHGESLCRRVNSSGVLRVEARRRNKPWIFSNPIYVV